MANSPRSRWPLRVARWLGFTLLGVLLLLGASWLAVPALVKHFGEQQIEAQLGRRASIGAVAFDPFELVLTVSDFTLYEPDRTSAALSAQTLLVDLAPAALFKLAPLLSELRLVGPKLHIVRTGGAGAARYNFSDVIERVLAMPKSAQPTLFSVANIQLENGAITFDDRVNDKQVKIEALSIGLPYVSNFPDQVDSFVQPRLSATVNGSPFALKGRSKPFAGSQDTALALDVERLDLASYMKFSPVALPLAVQGAKLSTKLDLSFVRKQGEPQLVLSGTIKLADVVLHDNRAAPLLKAREMLLQLRQLDVLGGVGALDKFEIVQPQLFLASDEVIDAERISLENARVDAAARTVSADALRLAGLRGEVRRDARGAFNVQQLSGRVGGPAKTAAAGPAPADKAAPAWLLTLKQFAVSDGAVAYTDGAVKPAVKLRADDFNLTLDDISSRFERPLKVALRTQLNKTGKLSIDGSIAPQFKSYDLAIDAQNLQVPALQPYFADYLNVTLASGQASSKGKLLLVPADAGKETATTYQGMLRLANFRMLDKENAADFLKWRALDVSGINLSLGGPRQSVALEKVALSDFYARIILSESAKLNLGNIVVSKNAPAGAPAPSLTSAEPAASSKATPLATAAVAAPPGKSNAPVIKIGQIVIKGGNINYTDNFVKPNYTANMTGMNGTVGAIASDKPQPAPLDLSGKIDNDAAVAISGTLNPLFSPMFLDIKASANGVELPRLTPYAAKYAGYAIEKGKLSMTVSYRVEDGKLVAQNDVRIDQLTFGEKIDGPSATKLPVMLAVALLKDRNGQININLPISGTLDDPQFSIGGIIVRIFLNLIVKAVTSPFALIGSAFGGGDELGYAEFSAGSAGLSEATQGKLDTIGKALTERPGLKLDLIGRVDPGSDADGVRQQVLHSQLNAFKRKESLDRGGDSAFEDGGVSDADKEKYMGKVYAAQKFDKPRNLVGLAKSLPPAEMEKLILANTPVTADALRALASRRAEAVRAYLETKGTVAPERIFLVAPKVTTDGIKDKGAPNRVDFALK